MSENNQQKKSIGIKKSIQEFIETTKYVQLNESIGENISKNPEYQNNIQKFWEKNKDDPKIQMFQYYNSLMQSCIIETLSANIDENSKLVFIKEREDFTRLWFYFGHPFILLINNKNNVPVDKDGKIVEVNKNEKEKSEIEIAGMREINIQDLIFQESDIFYVYRTINFSENDERPSESK